METQKPIILVVDDKQVFIELFREFLPNYDVVGVNDGLEALSIVKQQTPAMAFLDTEMPEITGPELCIQLRERGYTFPITGMSGHKLEPRWNNVGADGYHPKADLTQSPLVLQAIVQTALQQAYSEIRA